MTMIDIDKIYSPDGEDLYYTATSARRDYEAKVKAKNNFVDMKTMLGILDSIKCLINNIPVTDKTSVPRPTLSVGTLSIGEQEFLQNLGYKVKYYDGNINGDFWEISW